MKKYLSILAIFAVAAVACNKVEPQAVEETPEVVSGTNTVSFRANLPAFGVESKATISDTGEFAWEEDDWIYVLAYSKSKNSLWHVPFKYNTTTQQFTCDFPVSMYYIGGAENVQLDRVATLEEAEANRPFALYPDPQAATTEVAYDRVQKFFKMEGNLNSSGEIVFEHKSAMVNVHIANVPSIASYFTVAGGAEPVKVVNLDGVSSIDKAVPVTPTGSASDIVITLYDSSDNVIVSKKKSNKTLVAGTLYDTPVITLPTYTVAGSSYDSDEDASIFGTSWDINNTDNDMEYQSDGTFKKIIDVTAACKVKFKVVKDRNWGTAWPAGNYELNIMDAGKLTITFNPSTSTVSASVEYSSPYRLYVLDEKIATDADSWGSTRTLYANTDIPQFDSKTFGTYTYKVFLLPSTLVNQTLDIYYKGEHNCEVMLSDITITSAQENYYFRTDGILYTAVTDPSSPEALDETPRIYIRADAVPNCHMWGGITETTWPGTTATATTSKQYNDSWYYVDIIPSATNFIINFGGDSSKSKDQTLDDSTVSHYYYGYTAWGANWDPVAITW